MLTIMWLPPRYCLHDHLPNRGNDLSQGAACGVRKDLGCSVDQPPVDLFLLTYSMMYLLMGFHRIARLIASRTLELNVFPKQIRQAVTPYGNHA